MPAKPRLEVSWQGLVARICDLVPLDYRKEHGDEDEQRLAAVRRWLDGLAENAPERR
jgi:hypothetical protein